MTDEIKLAQMRDEASNLRILISRQETEARIREDTHGVHSHAPRVDVEAMRKRLAVIEHEIQASTSVGMTHDDPEAELLGLEKERAELTERMRRAENEWAEKVRSEGEASASERSELHDIRNRLQMIQAMTFRLKRQLGDES